MELHPHRIEQLHPREISKEINRSSIVYIPLGALEWHGLHLPIGLDGMTSHGFCLRAAEQMGGLVMPPLYYGMTGSIGHHPWTILLEKEESFLSIIRDTLNRLEDMEVSLAVLFTGHFGRRQLAALDLLKSRWSQESHTLTILVLSINQCPDATMKGDHGAIFETSLLNELHPSLVRLNRLPDVDEHPADDPDGNSWGDHRRDPANVLFGILGDDPRHYNKKNGKDLFDTVLTWFVSKVQEAI